MYRVPIRFITGGVAEDLHSVYGQERQEIRWKWEAGIFHRTDRKAGTDRERPRCVDERSKKIRKI